MPEQPGIHGSVSTAQLLGFRGCAPAFFVLTCRQDLKDVNNLHNIKLDFRKLKLILSKADSFPEVQSFDFFFLKRARESLCVSIHPTPNLPTTAAHNLPLGAASAVAFSMHVWHTEDWSCGVDGLVSTYEAEVSTDGLTAWGGGGCVRR